MSGQKKNKPILSEKVLKALRKEANKPIRTPEEIARLKKQLQNLTPK